MCAGLFFFRLSQKSVIAPLQVIWPRAVKQPQGEIIVVKFLQNNKILPQNGIEKILCFKNVFYFFGCLFQSLWKRKDERNLPLPVFVYGMCDALPRRNKADKSLLLLLYTAGGRGRSWRARAARVIKWVLSSNFHIWIERQWRNPMGLREGGSSKVVFVTVVWFFFSCCCSSSLKWSVARSVSIISQRILYIHVGRYILKVLCDFVIGVKTTSGGKKKRVHGGIPIWEPSVVVFSEQQFQLTNRIKRLKESRDLLLCVVLSSHDLPSIGHGTFSAASVRSK